MAGELIMLGAELGGQALNNHYSKKAAHRQWVNDTEMLKLQHEYALADWNMQNKYNSPVEQMKRLREGGLNPNLVYDNGASAGMSAAIRGGTPSGSETWKPQIDPHSIGNMIMQMADLRIKEAQADNLMTQNTVNKEQAAMIRAQREGVDMDNIGKTINLPKQSDLADINLEAKEWNIKQMEQQWNMTNFRRDMAQAANDREELMNADNHRLKLQELILKRWAATKAPYELKKLQQEFQNMKRDATLKDFEIMLNNAGMTKGDNIWYRALTGL